MGNTQRERGRPSEQHVEPKVKIIKWIKPQRRTSCKLQVVHLSPDRFILVPGDPSRWPFKTLNSKWNKEQNTWQTGPQDLVCLWSEGCCKGFPWAFRNPLFKLRKRINKKSRYSKWTMTHRPALLKDGGFLTPETLGRPRSWAAGLKLGQARLMLSGLEGHVLS